MRNLYEGTFNWHGEIFKFYRYAANKERAFFLMTLSLSGQLRRSHSSIKQYFNGEKDNYILSNKGGKGE
jgi:hypothetical protein